MTELYTTIFYPLNLQLPGYIYGWEVSKSTLSVAGVILSDSVGPSSLCSSIYVYEDSIEILSMSKLRQS